MKSNNKKLIAGSLGVLACLMNLVTSDAHARPGLTGPSVKGTYAARHGTAPCLVPLAAVEHLLGLAFELDLAWSVNAPNTLQLATELETDSARYAEGGQCYAGSSGLTSSPMTQQSTGSQVLAASALLSSMTGSNATLRIGENQMAISDVESRSVRNTPSEHTGVPSGDEEGPTTSIALTEFLKDFTPKAKLTAGFVKAAFFALNRGNPEGRDQAEPTLLEVREGHQRNS